MAHLPPMLPCGRGDMVTMMNSVAPGGGLRHRGDPLTDVQSQLVGGVELEHEVVHRATIRRRVLLRVRDPKAPSRAGRSSMLSRNSSAVTLSRKKLSVAS